MKKAFLFDMDGVIVDSERMWQKNGVDFARKLYGEKIFREMGDTTGMSLDHEYAFASSHGFTMPLDEFYRIYDQQARKVYAKAHITPGLDTLIFGLKDLGFTTGIVSSSRRPWIQLVIDMIGNTSLFDYSISLNERGLPSKPDPKGYLIAMEEIGVNAQTTIILEDSNSGIKAGRATNAFTIAFTPLLVPEYQQIPADAKANSFEEVLELVKNIVQKRK